MGALEFWTAQRAYPHRVIPDGHFYKAFEYSQRRLKKNENRLQTSDHWTSIGPTNLGGRTIALAVDPQNPNVIYAGAASGGLWRLTVSTNTDYSWEYIDTGYPVLGVNAVAVDPRNSDVIYIGTGEVYGYQNSIGGLHIRTTRGSYGIGLLKSTDRGNTWVKSIDWLYHQQRGVLCIRINPQNPDIIFAGTTEGTYRSPDAGDTWEKVHSVLMAVDIAINPVNPNIIYVSCGNLESPGHGIFRSFQGGNVNTWEKLQTGLPLRWGGKTMLAIYNSSPNIIYADIADTTDAQNKSIKKTTGLYRSTDYGDSWALVTNFDYASYQAWFSHYVRIHPTDDFKLFCAGVNFYTSNNGGNYLSLKFDMHVDHHAYADHPTNPDIVYFANDGGVYRTTDGGETIDELNNGYVTAQFYPGFSSSTANPHLALGGLQDNGTVMYQGTSAWRTWVRGGDGCFTAINAQNDDVMYSSMQWLQYLWRSTDGGSRWEDISCGFYNKNFCFVAPFVLSPSHPWVIYAGEDVIHRSEDMGNQWTVVNEKQPLNGNPVLSIGVSPTDPNVVYAATVPTQDRRAEVFASTNGGSSWQNITGDLPDRYYVDLHVSHHDDRVAYITLSGFGSSHLFRTEDGGETWQDIGIGLPDVPTSAVTVDPQEPNHIYIGNDLGVYVSTDYGGSWSEFKEGLPTAVLVMDLSISPSNRKLRAVTHGNGVYERTLLESSTIHPEDAIAAVESFRLYQNYPNPFNPSTKIAFSLPDPCFVTLKVFNAMGQEVRTLTSDGYPAGKFTVSWDGKNSLGQPVADGTYIYRFRAGNRILTKKMALIR